jgi:hypothetical protein
LSLTVINQHINKTLVGLEVEIRVFLISALGGGKRTFPRPFPFTATLLFMLYVDFRKAVIVSLQNINWLVFVTEVEGAYCAVRTGYLNIIEVDSNI